MGGNSMVACFWEHYDTRGNQKGKLGREIRYNACITNLLLIS